jgi:5-formyltetrahydrofolate cyclo-ligase
MPSSSDDVRAAELRQRIRAARRLLSPEAHRRARDLLARRIAHLTCFRRADSLAATLAFDGEADPAEAVRMAWAEGKRVYLPVLRPGRTLLFAPYTAETSLAENRFGILEPSVADEDLIGGRDLDLVLTPLVAFDELGNRMGMGGGFYDRSFAFLLQNPTLTRPVLLGIALDLQRVPALAPQPWDVPLHGVVTERRTFAIRPDRL